MDGFVVEKMRDGHPQARHPGHAVVVDRNGSLVQAWGDASHGVWWRSCAKPLQAVPSVRAGTPGAFGLSARHLSAACGSHATQLLHIQAAREILDAAGLDESQLTCGTHPVAEAAAMPTPAGGWAPIHNNCSSKHAMMLATCKHRGWPTEGYESPTHPLQAEMAAVMADATGESRIDMGGDGCGLPTYWTRIEAMAGAFAWLGRQPEGDVIYGAMAEHPYHYAGTHRLDTHLVLATGGDVVTKIGAAGVHAGIHRPSGHAFALKVESGDIQSRDAACVALCSAMGWVDSDLLSPWSNAAVRDNAGRVRGRVVARFE